MRDIGILGGGLSGLFLARFLGGDCEVLEAEDTPGGLARCFRVESPVGTFRSDIGGHILFSKDEEALSHELAPLRATDNLVQKPRVNRILYDSPGAGKVHLRYPFENGINDLPPEERATILESYLASNDGAEPRGLRLPPENFHEWIVSTFGREIADQYLLPYNQKIWKTPLDTMSLGWVSRVPKPPIRDVIRSACGVPTEGYTHQSLFHYPKRGGFEALPKAVAKGLGEKVLTNRRVDLIAKTEAGWDVTVSSPFARSPSGKRTFETRSYRAIVSTLPLETTLDLFGMNARPAREGLRHNGLRVVVLGFRGDPLLYTAIYVPRPGAVYHRVCFDKGFAGDASPEGFSSVSCEITVAPGSLEESWSDDAWENRVRDDLNADGLVSWQRCVTSGVHREERAYPVYTHGHEAIVKGARGALAAKGVRLLGRFAEHAYINSDVVVRHALDLAREMRGGDIAEEARISPHDVPTLDLGQSRAVTVGG